VRLKPHPFKASLTYDTYFRDTTLVIFGFPNVLDSETSLLLSRALGAEGLTSGCVRTQVQNRE